MVGNGGRRFIANHSNITSKFVDGYLILLVPQNYIYDVCTIRINPSIQVDSFDRYLIAAGDIGKAPLMNIFNLSICSSLCPNW